jgi:two-component system sensor histidine kinase/response regulator
MMTRRLTREGFGVETVADGPLALERVAAGGVDLVLLDVMMPGMSGLDVVTRLRVHHPPHELPVIMVTAVDQSEMTVEALGRGANDFVAKPVDFPVLLARLRTQLRLKQLGDLKDEFFRMASHDLRNPLTRVLSGAGVVLSLRTPGEPLSDDLVEVLEGVRRGAGEMQQIIEDFLEFGALADDAFTLRLRPVDLPSLLARVVDAARGEAEAKGIGLTVDAPPAAAIPADVDRLRQVMNNLVSNALKFSQPGTAVAVRCRAAGGRLRVEVRDEGPGFGAEDVDRVFERYAKLTARPTGGERSTGLGLSICRRIVGLHGGTIGFANNDPGPGATLWFELGAKGP